jgi:hypothetical protein
MRLPASPYRPPEVRRISAGGGASGVPIAERLVESELGKVDFEARSVSNARNSVPNDFLASQVAFLASQSTFVVAWKLFWDATKVE